MSSVLKNVSRSGQISIDLEDSHGRFCTQKEPVWHPSWTMLRMGELPWASVWGESCGPNPKPPRAAISTPMANRVDRALSNTKAFPIVNYAAHCWCPDGERPLLSSLDGPGCGGQELAIPLWVPTKGFQLVDVNLMADRLGRTAQVTRTGIHFGRFGFKKIHT